MQATDPTSTRSNCSDPATIFVPLELSRAVWLVTALLPGGNQKMSRHQVPGGDLTGLLSRFAELQRKAHARTGQLTRIVVIQEAGLEVLSQVMAEDRKMPEQHVAAYATSCSN
jgi:transposase